LQHVVSGPDCQRHKNNESVQGIPARIYKLTEEKQNEKKYQNNGHNPVHGRAVWSGIRAGGIAMEQRAW
jgi:hypothetical protein